MAFFNGKFLLNTCTHDEKSYALTDMRKHDAGLEVKKYRGGYISHNCMHLHISAINASRLLCMRQTQRFKCIYSYSEIKRKLYPHTNTYTIGIFLCFRKYDFFLSLDTALVTIPRISLLHSTRPNREQNL